LPASVFSRSTEAHNQDKVSMGTIAARDCLRVLELTEQVAAAHSLAAVQALRLRVRLNYTTPVPARLQAFAQRIGALSPFVDEDRALESDLRALTAQIADCVLMGDGHHE
jgi:histidine ammonia-lyase